MRLTLLTGLTLSLALLCAPPASADDTSVKRAWDSEDSAFAALGRSVGREQASWQRRGFTRDGRMLALMRRGERLCRAVVQRLETEQPSSPTGTDARQWALRSTRTFTRYFVAERRAIRATTRRPTARARTLQRRAASLNRLSRRQAARGRELFKRLGLA